MPNWSSTRATMWSTMSSIDLRLVVEGRHRRQDRHAHARQLEHVLEMDLRQRRLARHQHQLAALLEHHVGGALHQAVTEALGDRGQGLHRAGCDDHAVGLERAGRNRRRHVAAAVHDAGQRAQFRRGQAGLMLDGLQAPLGQHQVGFDLGSAQGLQQAHAEDGAGGAGDAHDQSAHLQVLVSCGRSRLTNIWTIVRVTRPNPKPVGVSVRSTSALHPVSGRC